MKCYIDFECESKEDVEILKDAYTNKFAIDEFWEYHIRRWIKYDPPDGKNIIQTKDGNTYINLELIIESYRKCFRED